MTRDIGREKNESSERAHTHNVTLVDLFSSQTNLLCFEDKTGLATFSIVF